MCDCISYNNGYCNYYDVEVSKLTYGCAHNATHGQARQEANTEEIQNKVHYLKQREVPPIERKKSSRVSVLTEAV